MILEKFLSKAVMGAANAFPDLQSVTEAGGHSSRVFLTKSYRRGFPRRRN